MPTREQTVADAISIFENATYPGGLSLETAWLGIYQTLLWYESVDHLGFSKLPHIIDADKLRPASPAKRRTWRTPKAWQLRAKSANEYLARHLGRSPEDAPDGVDLLMRQRDYAGMQRQNSLGIAFPGIIRHVLEKFGCEAVSYDTEVEAGDIFTGVSVPGRSRTPRIDLLARCGGLPRAIISTKWSLRHDRLNDITNECPAYKSAYQRIYRQQGDSLYYVVTNEYDPSRLNKILDDSCVDGVVHVHKTVVLEICNLDGRLARLLDLADLVNATFTW